MIPAHKAISAGPSDPAGEGWTAAAWRWSTPSLRGYAPVQLAQPVADGLTEALGFDLMLWAGSFHGTQTDLRGEARTSPVADGGAYADGQV